MIIPLYLPYCNNEKLAHRYQPIRGILVLRRHRNVVVRAFIVGILFGISAIVAFAAYAESNWRYYGPINGYSYKNQAVVTNDFGYIAAETYVSNQAWAQVPTGYMGARARLYNSSGTLRASSNWFYNSQPVMSIGVGIPCNQCSSGTYYSRGLTAAYNGNGYTENTTFSSPNIQH